MLETKKKQITRKAHKKMSFYKNVNANWIESDSWKNEYDMRIYDKAEASVSEVYMVKRGNKVWFFNPRQRWSRDESKKLIEAKLLTGKTMKISSKERISKTDFLQEMNILNLRRLVK